MRKIFPPILLLMAMLFPSIVHAQCNNVDFTSSITKGCAPLGIQFAASNIPAGAKIEWNLGGGFIAGKDTVFRAFVVPGKKTISLRITENGKTVPCTTIVKTDFVEVLEKPEINLYISDSLVCAGKQQVTLIDSTPNIVAREWIIDGVKRNATTTIQEVFKFGKHSVSLSVTNSDGCKELYKNNEAIAIYNSESFEFASDMVQIHNKIEATFKPGFFDNQPKRKFQADKKIPIAYEWTLPGANITSSTAKNPKVVYNNLSTSYDVGLEVTYQGGCKYQHSKTAYVTKFMSVNDTVLCIGEDVTVTNLASKGGRLGLTFSFPGGNFVSGNTSSQFSIDYGSLGFKDVKYSFMYGTDTGSLETVVIGDDLVEVQGPLASLRANDKNRCKADTIQLYSRSTLPSNPGNNIFTWEFFDSDSIQVPGTPVGPTINGDTIDFPFTVDGVYDAMLIVTNSFNGCIDTAYEEDYLRLIRPRAEFSIEDSSICIGEEVKISAQTIPSGTATNKYTYYWELKHQTNPKGRYTTRTEIFNKTLLIPGIYDLFHVATSSKTCADTTEMLDSIIVNGNEATLTQANPVSCPGSSSKFKVDVTSDYPGTSAPTLKWKIKPRVGITIIDSLTAEPTIKFDVPGCYKVSVEIINSEGCINTETQNVCVGTIANWGFDQDSVNVLCLGEPLTLYDSSFVNANYHKWLIEPSSAGHFVPNDSLFNSKLVFDRSGTFKVSMALSSDSLWTCPDTMSHFITIITTEAKFKVDKPLTLCAPQTITFTNQSSNAFNYIWDYGDGETSTNANTEHSYVYTKNNTAGFVPKLIAVKFGGVCTDTFELPSKVRIIGPEPKFALDTTLGCDSVTVNYTNLTSPLNSDYYFDYGDGGVPDTNRIRAHKYDYPVNSTADSVAFYPTIVANSLGCQSFYTDTVILYKKPSAAFSVDTMVGCSPLLVEFYNESKDYFNTFWDLDGDGNTDSTGQDTVSFNFSTGKYSPRLVVEYKGTCTDTAVLDTGIKALAIPTARLSLSTRRGCDSLMVAFTANNPGDSFIIEYGNGLSDTNNVDTVYYKFDINNSSGDSSTYVVKYFVTSPSSNACSDTLWDTVRVYRQPTAAFVTDTNQGCAPLQVNFYNQSKNYNAIGWDFDGDGITDTSNVDTVTLTYNQGMYGASLAIETNIGCRDTFRLDSFITVRDIPVADLSVSTFAGCDSLAVSFKPNNPQNSYYIDYGNGTHDSNSIANQLYGFNTLNKTGDSTNYPLLYVALDTILTFCADTIDYTKNGRPISVFRQPVASFTTDTTLGCAPSQINFYNTSDSHDINNWFFDRDLIPDAINADTTSFVYNAGVHGAALFIQTLKGCRDTVLVDSFITIVNFPIADFKLDTAVGCDSLAVQFSANNPTDSFIVNYGFGNNDTNSVSAKLYGYDKNNSNGDSTNYAVTYVAFNKTIDFCTDTAQSIVTVYRQPIADFGLDTNFGCEPLDITFTNKSEGEFSRTWYFLGGKDTTDTNNVVKKQYSAGKYSTGLAIISPNGCKDSVYHSDNIQALKSPEIKFTQHPDTVCNGGLIEFTDRSVLDTLIYSRLWEFDPRGSNVTGDRLIVPKPEVSFLSTNTFDSFLVKLTIADSNFCSTSDSQYVYTLESPTPDTISIARVSFQQPAGSGNGIEVRWRDNYADNISYVSIMRVIGTDTTEIYSGQPISNPLILDNGVSNPLSKKASYYVNVGDTCGKLSGLTKLKATYPTLKGGNSGEQSVTLNWTDQVSASPTTNFVILRSAKSTGPFKAIDSVDEKTFSYTDTTLYCNAKYFYSVLARNAFGSMVSNIIQGTGKFVPPIGSPLLKNATIIDNKHGQINWVASTQPGLDQYIIDRKTPTGSWQSAFDSTKNTSYTDSNIAVNSEYYEYKVYTKDVCLSTSGKSNSARTLLLTSETSLESIKLSWNKYFEWNVDFHYEVQLMDATGNFNTIAQVANDITEYEDKNSFLNLDTPWCYRVIAVQDLGSKLTSVSNEFCFSTGANIYFPNAFSPNKDGINETFFIYADAIKKVLDDDDKKFSIKIYDRWGERIFESTDVNATWDGTKNGESVPLGKYLVVIEATKFDGEQLFYKGTITIIK